MGTSCPCGSPRRCDSGRSLPLRADCLHPRPRMFAKGTAPQAPPAARQPHEHRKPPATGREEGRLFQHIWGVLQVFPRKAAIALLFKLLPRRVFYTL